MSFKVSPTQMKRWHRAFKTRLLLSVILVSCLVCYTIMTWKKPAIHLDMNITKRFIEQRLREAVKASKGTGCLMPRLDPFSAEVTQFDEDLPKVTCPGQDWVKCYHSECRVRKKILDMTLNVECTYKDIIYDSDRKYHLGPPVVVQGDNAYLLSKSDHVRVTCTGRNKFHYLPTKWIGAVLGYRSLMVPKLPPGPVDKYNVLIFGFDSTSKNGFIRRMPKSYKYLVEEIQATVLHSYNILGDGTPAALFPILSGKTELEMPDARKSLSGNTTLDADEFIFSKMKKDGYRTAYLEDCPTIGTFQYRFNGFNKQPADHYLRAFFLEDRKVYGPAKKYCVGDTPRYRLLMDITKQFFKLEGKLFCFTFIADITHNDFNMISTADDDTVEFLKNFKETGLTNNTILFVMGDHGARYTKARSTLQGRLEERLPLMAIRLPDQLVSRRPSAHAALKRNQDVLTTPHDIHATILDALGLRELINPYMIEGADLARSLSLLEPIPKNRSCSEAGIEPHWCACARWVQVRRDDAMFSKAAAAVVTFINQLTEPVRSKCALRILIARPWVMKQKVNEGVLAFREAIDADGFLGNFGPQIEVLSEVYQAKITVAPGKGDFEATMTYRKKEDKFYLNVRDISRTNKYNDEPDCIHLTHPHLNMFCYCKSRLFS